jgi:hypothetical protein
VRSPKHKVILEKQRIAKKTIKLTQNLDYEKGRSAMSSVAFQEWRKTGQGFFQPCGPKISSEDLLESHKTARRREQGTSVVQYS